MRPHIPRGEGGLAKFSKLVDLPNIPPPSHGQAGEAKLPPSCTKPQLTMGHWLAVLLLLALLPTVLHCCPDAQTSCLQHSARGLCCRSCCCPPSPPWLPLLPLLPLPEHVQLPVLLCLHGFHCCRGFHCCHGLHCRHCLTLVTLAKHGALACPNSDVPDAHLQAQPAAGRSSSWISIATTTTTATTITPAATTTEITSTAPTIRMTWMVVRTASFAPADGNGRVALAFHLPLQALLDVGCTVLACKLIHPYLE